MARRAVLAALFGLVACLACTAQAGTTVITPRRGERLKVPKGTVTGTVFCADTNQPARMAHVTLEPITSTGGRSFAAETDLEGRFRIGNLPEGKYHVAGELLGYLNPLAQWHDLARKTASEERQALEASLTTVYVSAQQAATVALRLERGAEISGSVLFDDGSPAVGIHVSLKPKAAEPESGTDAVPVVVEYMEYAERTTDDRGRFRILGVAPGEYTVNVDLPTVSAEREQNMFVTMIQGSQLGSLAVYFGDTLRASKAKTIKIAGGETRGDADITIPLARLHTIRGHVVVKSTGEAPPTAGVELLYADTREEARMAVAVDGDFEFPYVADDSYILRAVSSAEPLPKMEADEDDGDLSFSLGGAFGVRINGRLPTEKTGELAVLVHGDMSGLVIETPDPMPVPKGGAAQQTTLAPEETEKPESPQ